MLSIFATALTLNGELQQRDFFGAASLNETDPTRSLEWFRRRLAFLGGDSRTRASLVKELKVSIRSDVPALDPDRTGTGRFDRPHQPAPDAGFFKR